MTAPVWGIIKLKVIKGLYINSGKLHVSQFFLSPVNLLATIRQATLRQSGCLQKLQNKTLGRALDQRANCSWLSKLTE